MTSRARGVPLEVLDAAGWEAIVPSLFAALDAMENTALGATSGFGGWDRSGHAPHKNRNVLVDQGRITGIFDWGCSMHADPIFDLAWLSFWSPWHLGLQSMNIVDRWQAHATATGRSLSGFDDRLRACHLAIGVDHLGYNAFMNRWDDLATLADYLERFVDS